MMETVHHKLISWWCLIAGNRWMEHKIQLIAFPKAWCLILRDLNMIDGGNDQIAWLLWDVTFWPKQAQLPKLTIRKEKQGSSSIPSSHHFNSMLSYHLDMIITPPMTNYLSYHMGGSLHQSLSIFTKRWCLHLCQLRNCTRLRTIS